MIRTLVMTVFVSLCAADVGLPQTPSKCEPNAAPTAEQQARRRDGVRIARLVNTAEANQPGAASRNYLRQDQLATSPYLQKRMDGQEAFVKSLNFNIGEDVLPGWELKVDVTNDGYWFIVRDQTDACGFAYISNQNGMIYTAEPLR